MLLNGKQIKASKVENSEFRALGKIQNIPLDMEFFGFSFEIQKQNRKPKIHFFTIT